METLEYLAHVSNFYEPGRQALEEKLAGVITLDQAVAAIRGLGLYGAYPTLPAGSDEVLVELYGRQEFASSARQALARVTGSLQDRVVASIHAFQDGLYEKFQPIYQAQFPDDVGWEILRDLGPLGKVDYVWVESADANRCARRFLQDYNLGTHFYRASGPTDSALVGLPELRCVGGVSTPSYQMLRRSVIGAGALTGVLGLSLSLLETPNPMINKIGYVAALVSFTLLGLGYSLPRNKDSS